MPYEKIGKRYIIKAGVINSTLIKTKVLPMSYYDIDNKGVSFSNNSVVSLLDFFNDNTLIFDKKYNLLVKMISDLSIQLQFLKSQEYYMIGIDFEDICVVDGNPSNTCVQAAYSTQFLDSISQTEKTALEKNITAFFKGIGVEGLGAGNVARIIQAGFDSVAKIINMDIDDYLSVDGFKEKMATKLHNGIQEKIDESPLTLLMSASNIFGRGFSSKKIELIMKELPYILLSDDDEGQKVKDVAAIKGMATKTAEAFVERIPAFVDFLNDIGQEDKLYEDENETGKKTESIDTTNPLYAKSIVLTGFRDKNISELIKKVGAVEGSSVSKNTFVVLVKSKDEDTSKAETARKLGVPIMTPNEFLEKFNL